MDISNPLSTVLKQAYGQNSLFESLVLCGLMLYILAWVPDMDQEFQKEYLSLDHSYCMLHILPIILCA